MAGGRPSQEPISHVVPLLPRGTQEGQPRDLQHQEHAESGKIPMTQSKLLNEGLVPVFRE